MRFVNLTMIAVIGIFLLVGNASAEKRFLDSVGNVQVGDVTVDSDGYIVVPYILWGADVVTFYANGGLKTTPDSIFGKLGLKIRLVPGDDTVKQGRDYLTGKSPFYRLTFRQGGVAAEVLGYGYNLRAVTLLQMSWSGGDHLVVKSDRIKRISDIKGKKFAAMYNPPQIGMIQDILDTAKLTWKDIEMVWTPDILGENGPDGYLRNRSDIDGAFCITPGMFGLTGDIHTIGDGGETMLGAKVLVSTQDEMSRSIWDGYYAREDWYRSNRDWAHKFAAGYMKATEEVLELKKEYESKGSKRYMQLLQMAQDIYGKDALPTLEVDAHGLVADARLVGYPGNVAFFEETGNTNGFDAFMKSALNLGISQGYIKEKKEFLTSGLDYNSPFFVGYLKNTNVTRTKKFRAEAMEAEIAALNAGELDERRIDYFTIPFPPEGDSFEEKNYKEQFQRTIEWAGKYGNAGIAIRGHADPAWTIIQLVQAGIKKGIINRSGTKGNYTYYFEGQPLNLGSTAKIVAMIKDGKFDGIAEHNPKEAMGAALALSKSRAQAFIDATKEYAKSKELVFDPSQLVPVGVGITEPLIPKPRNMEEASKNMRAEITLIRVSAEVKSDSDFDY